MLLRYDGLEDPPVWKQSASIYRNVFVPYLSDRRRRRQRDAQQLVHFFMILFTALILNNGLSS